MATLNLYLDTRRQRKDGTSQIKLSVNCGRSCRLVPLGIFVTAEYWDSANRKVKGGAKGHPYAARFNTALRQMLLAAQAATLCASPDMNADALAGMAECAIFPERAEKAAEDAKPAKPTLAQMAARFAAMKTEKNTRLSYESTVRHLERFRGGDTPDEVTPGWLSEFDAHLAKSCHSPNARALHMRNLRAVFNFAIDEGMTANYPFRRFKIKTVRTAKRSLDAAQLRTLLTMEVEEWQSKYRDFFALSFFLAGTNAKDLLFLPPGADASGRIEFNRAKTGKLYSFRVEPEAAAMIERYRGKSHMLEFMDSRTDYLQFVRRCNHALKLIGTESRKGSKPEGAPLFPYLTTYYARHSWATVAAELDIPKETIAAALGHDMGNSTTAIYINFNQRKIDDANRRVIDFVLYGKR